LVMMSMKAYKCSICDLQVLGLLQLPLFNFYATTQQIAHSDSSERRL
jgi:hypothetical protein